MRKPLFGRIDRRADLRIGTVKRQRDVMKISPWKKSLGFLLLIVNGWKKKKEILQGNNRAAWQT